MKYCSHCGQELADQAEVCSNCGCRITPEKKQSKPVETNHILGLVAKIFMILTCAFCGFMASIFVNILLDMVVDSVSSDIIVGLDMSTWLPLLINTAKALIPLAWCIPITVVVCKRLGKKQPVGTGLKVCTLIFVNLVAGILLLCMKAEPTTAETVETKAETIETKNE